MRTDPTAFDLCCMPGPSGLIISSMAQMSSPFDQEGLVGQSKSVLQAAERVAEIVPDPYMRKIMDAVPVDIAERAVSTVSRESRMLVNLGFESIRDNDFHQRCVQLANYICPWAFIMSRGVSSVLVDIEKISLNSVARRMNGLIENDCIYPVNGVSPGDGAWNIWSHCEDAWGKLPGLSESLDNHVMRMFRPSALLEEVGQYIVKVDFFAWSIEVDDGCRRGQP
jgi:hypothetical protein